MAETLLCLLLVTSSAKGSSLVYRWPPSPVSTPRLSRPRPKEPVERIIHADNPWKAANLVEGSTILTDHIAADDSDDYIWTRSADGSRDRSMSFSHPGSHPSSGRTSPIQDIVDTSFEYSDDGVSKDSYENLLGYSAEFLAGLLCPKQSLCHQKFELIVDDLAFIGHPVCSEKDGKWKFKMDKQKPDARGRNSRKNSSHLQKEEGTESPFLSEVENSSSSSSEAPSSPSSWLQTFHFILVLDLPDPSSSASGNITKYFDIIYEHIAFTVTAVLFQEQVLSNFVETECDLLGSLKDDYISKGQPFADYMAHALKASSIAPAMKSLYESIKSCSIANITIHDLPLELQLPPYLDLLLHNDDLEDEFVSHAHDGEDSWGKDMGFAWRLPVLEPWKSLLLLDDDDSDDRGENLYMNLMGQNVMPEDRLLGEQLIKFLELTSITLSLADMGSLLDWDLATQVYPTVKWLVHHRRAKIVDIVHPQLKTVFTLSSKFHAPLSELTKEFERDFPYDAVSPLPTILSIVSTSTHKQSDNHFFAAVVKSKDLIPLYQDVVIWMLKRDLLVTLHLRVRVVAIPELKDRVRVERDLAKARKTRMRESSLSRGRGTGPQDVPIAEEDGSPTWFSLSPKTARRKTRRTSSQSSSRSRVSDIAESVIAEDEDVEEEEYGSSDANDGSEAASDVWPSMIGDPGRATPKERRWLTAMSEGKDPYIVKRFELINQFFDGKCTDDQILYQADISRKQLREVLHHYDEYVSSAHAVRALSWQLPRSN